MSRVNATSTFGNSKWSAHAEITDAQRDILANLGFLWVMQRSPSSRAEKVIAGYEKRPDKFKRSSLEFNDAFVEKLTAELGKQVPIDEDGKVMIAPVVDDVKFHEIGKGTEPVYADEKKIVARHIEARDIVTWATDKVGFTGEGDLDVENVEFLRAVKAYKQRILADS